MPETDLDNYQKIVDAMKDHIKNTITTSSNVTTRSNSKITYPLYPATNGLVPVPYHNGGNWEIEYNAPKSRGENKEDQGKYQKALKKLFDAIESLEDIEEAMEFARSILEDSEEEKKDAKV